MRWLQTVGVTVGGRRGPVMIVGRPCAKESGQPQLLPPHMQSRLALYSYTPGHPRRGHPTKLQLEETFRESVWCC